MEVRAVIDIPVTVEFDVGKKEYRAYADMNGSKRIIGRGDTPDLAVADFRKKIAKAIRKIWW